MMRVWRRRKKRYTTILRTVISSPCKSNQIIFECPVFYLEYFSRSNVYFKLDKYAKQSSIFETIQTEPNS